MMNKTLQETTINGGDVLASYLFNLGVRRVFTVAGESYLPLIEGLDKISEIDIVTNRRESGATMMAEVHARLSGKPSVAMVTRGPGATNASCAVHIAAQNSTPLLLLVGQVERNFSQREAFQEIDYIRFFNPICKWVAEIQDPKRIGEYILRAFHTMLTARPGPVVLVLPKDMLDEKLPAKDLPKKPIKLGLPEVMPSKNDLENFSAILQNSDNPVIICGGAHWSKDSCHNLQEFAQKYGITVFTSFRRQDYFDNSHPCFAGSLSAVLPRYCLDNLKSADCIILLGTRLGEIASCGYQVINIPTPNVKLVHIYPGADEFGKVYKADLAILSKADYFCAALTKISIKAKTKWRKFSQKANRLYHRSLDEVICKDEFSTAQVMKCLDRSLPDNAIICNGAGNYAAFLHRYYQHKSFPTQIGSVSGSMGYGLPAAIAAKLLYPDVPVVAVSGDGCFMMESQEMSVAFERGLPIIVIIIDNGCYGTIRMYQYKRTPKRMPATSLVNPDFVALAKAQGWRAIRIENIPQLRAELQQNIGKTFIENKRPLLLHIKTSPHDIAPHFIIENNNENT